MISMFCLAERNTARNTTPSTAVTSSMHMATNLICNFRIMGESPPSCRKLCGKVENLYYLSGGSGASRQ